MNALYWFFIVTAWILMITGQFLPTPWNAYVAAASIASAVGGCVTWGVISKFKRSGRYVT